jgi:hypothetical protein
MKYIKKIAHGYLYDYGYLIEKHINKLKIRITDKQYQEVPYYYYYSAKYNKEYESGKRYIEITEEEFNELVVLNKL